MEIINDTRSDCEEIVSFCSHLPVRNGNEKNPLLELPHTRHLAYCNLSPDTFDFLPEIACSIGMQLDDVNGDIFQSEQHVLVNCIRAPACKLVGLRRPRADRRVLIITDAEDLEPYRRFGTALSLPASYAALAAACREVASEPNVGLPRVPKDAFQQSRSNRPTAVSNVDGNA